MRSSAWPPGAGAARGAGTRLTIIPVRGTLPDDATRKGADIMQTLAKPGPAALGAGRVAGAAFWAVRRAADRTSQRSPAVARPGAPRVLILGAGFGGITTAVELGRLAQRGLNAD